MDRVGSESRDRFTVSGKNRWVRPPVNSIAALVPPRLGLDAASGFWYWTPPQPLSNIAFRGH